MIRHRLSNRARRAQLFDPQAGSEEQGFTLIELLLVVVLLPMIMGAVAVAIIVSLQDSAGVSNKLADSVDSQVSSVYYGRDVQSASYMTTSGSLTSAPWTVPTNGPAVCSSTGTFILGLAWPSGSGSSQSVVSYWSQGLASATDGSTNGTSTLNAASQPPGFTGFTTADIGQAVVETDSQGAIPNGTTIVSVSSSTMATLSTNTVGGSVSGVAFTVGPKLVRQYCQGTNAATSRIVSHDYFAPLTTAVIVCSASASTCTANDGTQWVSTGGVASISLAIKEPTSQYNYSLTATPRNTLALTSAQKGKTPSLLLLGGGVVINQSNGTINVNGAATINSGTFSQSNGNFNATTIYGTYSPESTGACTTGGATCKNVCQSNCTWATAGAVGDPLAPLPDPSEPANKINACPTSGALSPGEYTCPLTISGTATMTSGLYVFDQGVDIGTQGSLDGRSGVLIYLPCNSSNNNNKVDTWAPSCTESLTLESGAQLLMNPIATGPYAGLWFWQNLGDTSQITQKGPANNNSVTGYLYAPGAIVNIKSGTGVADLGGMIAFGIQMQNGTLTVSPS